MYINSPLSLDCPFLSATLCLRWTDNVHALQSWLVRKKGMSAREAKDTLKQMGVNVDMDYVDA